MKKMLYLFSGLLFIYALISCSSLPVKEVELAKKELAKAEKNQGPTLSEDSYQAAEASYKAAEKFLKEEKGEEAKSEAGNSLTKSRESILAAKEKRAKEQIEKVETILNEVLNRGKLEKELVETDKDLGEMATQKLQLVKDTRAAFNLLREGKASFSKGKDMAPQVDKQKNKLEELKEVDQYILLMNTAYDKALEAEKLLNVHVEKLRQVAAMYDMVSKGNELIAALEKDPFVSLYYEEEKVKVIDDFKQFKKSVEENNLEEAEKNKGAYDNLQTFFDKMKNEKLALAGSYAALSEKVLGKVKGFYKKDAESYLEKAKRLKEEVNRVYKKGPSPQPAADDESDYAEDKELTDEEATVAEDSKVEEKKSETEENKKEEVVDETTDKKEEAVDEENVEKKEEAEKEIVTDKPEEVKKKPNNPEDLMLENLENLYNDAENLFNNEEYTDSIEKAKATIELAEKMLALKKAIVQKDQQGAGFFSKDVKFIEYKVKTRDYLWKIAYRKNVYGKAYLWPLIWFANKSVVKNPHRIFPGTVLQVPIFKK